MFWYSVFFFTREKKSLPEKIFNILPEKFSNQPRRNLENCPRRKTCAREKNSKILPEKKKRLPEKKMQNCARENVKSTREKIRSKISSIHFFHAISGTVAGLCYGDYSSICLMLSSRLCNRYFRINLCAPAASSEPQLF